MAPVSMAAMSPTERKTIKTVLMTEQFEWAPETFAREGMDIANESLYTATHLLEQRLQDTIRAPLNDALESPTTLSLPEDDLQKGVYRLETLLETSIDKQFDLFEIYVLRNTFDISDTLVPYVVLNHQAHLDPALQGQDAVAITEYEEELALYESELTRARELSGAAQYWRQRVQAAEAKARDGGFLGSAGSLSDTVEALATQVAHLSTSLARLLDTPAPPSHGAAPSQNNPWPSRSSYVNQAVESQLGGLPGSAREAGDLVVGEMRGDMDKTGRQQDADDLVKLL